MTKTITIPISSEKCDIIKTGFGWFLWIGFTVAMMYVFIHMWYDFGNMGYDGNRVLIGFVAILGSIASPLVMIWYLKENDHWIEFRCNCDKEVKDD